jgi:hypothetical protein
LVVDGAAGQVRNSLEELTGRLAPLGGALAASDRLAWRRVPPSPAWAWC